MRAARNLACAAALALGPGLALIAGVPEPALAEVPQVTILAPASGGSIDNPKPTLSGTSSDSLDQLSVTICPGASPTGPGCETLAPTLPLGGDWSASVETPLPDGQYTAVAEQAELGEPTGVSAPVSFTVDTTPPAVSMKAVAQFTNDPTPTLQGKAGTATGDLDSVTVSLYSSATGTPLATEAVVPSSGSGSWSYTTPSLSNGATYTVQASQLDEAGNEGLSTAETFTVDTVAPLVSLTTPPTYTNDSTPTLGGGAGHEAGDDGTVTVRLYAGAGTAGTLVHEASEPLAGGAWSYTPSTLPDGVYTVQAEQSDEAGNEGFSGVGTFTVDTSKPTITLTPLAEFTNNPTPTLKGAAGAAGGDLPAVKVKVFSGANTGGAVVSELKTTATGSAWSVVTPTLPDGTYTAQASQLDEAANQGFSATTTFTVDTVAPIVSVNAPPTYTKEAAFKVTGSLGGLNGDLPSVAVVVYKGSSTSGTVAASGSATVSGSSWSFTTSHLEDGAYTVQAKQSDKAGNTGASNSATFTVDTKAPGVTINSVPSYTKDKTPTLEGSLGAAPGDRPLVAVKVYSGTIASGTPVREGEATVSAGTWSYTPATNLADGKYTVQASQSDEAGNVGVSAPATFAVDTKAPTVSLTAPTPGQHFHVARLAFGGGAGSATGDKPAVTLDIFREVAGEEVLYEEVSGIGLKEGGTTWGLSGSPLPNGNYSVLVKQSDEAGNVGESKAVRFIVEAQSPDVTLSPLGLQARAGSTVLFSGATPTFTGSAEANAQDSKQVQLTIYDGTSATGTVAATATGTRNGSSWSIGPVAGLVDGETYTAQAEQSATGEETGVSEKITFQVDADPPAVTLSSPSDGSSVVDTNATVSGAAGSAPGDDAAVTVRIYQGSEASGTPAEMLTVASTEGRWFAPLGALTLGLYTVRAEQSDDVGNIGLSAPVTFTVTEPAPPPPPTASFKWFPAAPHVGEPISLVSTSTDPSSAIVSYAWSLAGNGNFTAGNQSIGTVFTSPGNHVVQLRVTDANGASSTIAETVAVTTLPVNLMQPFPVVRIAGSEVGGGVTIKLLTVLAPVGAKVTINCKGKGCPAKTLSRTVAASSNSKRAAGTVLIVFKRFERKLPAGLTLEIRVSKTGEIGKYTRFATRRGKLPTRQDTCLSTAGKPMECPST